MQATLVKTHTILVVDDDDDIRDTLAEILQFEGYDVVTATNGKEALAILKDSPDHPCVILADLMMPVMSGWELRTYQQEDPDLEVIPMVAVSAMADPATPPKFTAYLKKPIQLDMLLSILEKHCSQQNRN